MYIIIAPNKTTINSLKYKFRGFIIVNSTMQYGTEISWILVINRGNMFYVLQTPRHQSTILTVIVMVTLIEPKL